MAEEVPISKTAEQLIAAINGLFQKRFMPSADPRMKKLDEPIKALRRREERLRVLREILNALQPIGPILSEALNEKKSRVNELVFCLTMGGSKHRRTWLRECHEQLAAQEILLLEDILQQGVPSEPLI